MEKIVEICCGSYEDALAAYRGGAKRIELNSALYLGGLTPSLGTLLLAKKNTDLKIIAMVRPRGAGFCYSGDDFAVMKADAELLLDRVLTSGGKEKAVEGREMIQELQETFGGRIEVLAGSGVNAGNAKELMEQTGIFQVHSSCRGWLADPTTEGPEVTYAYAAPPHNKDYEAVDEKLVKKLVDAI